ncbi:MAG: T9SS type A sorting domain-containing protein [Bacteroidota bacterium]
MRKANLLFIILLSIVITSNAQVVFQENFDTITDGAMPSNWTRFNIDGLTPAANVSYISNAWVSLKKSLIPTKAAWSTSWYSTAGTSDDWMFTPAITIPSTNPILKFTEYAPDAANRDGYEVRILTTAPTISNLMSSAVLLSVPAAASTPTIKSIDLSAYSNQSVYIAWRNNSTDKFLLAIDDIVIKTVYSLDAEITEIKTSSIHIDAGNYDITGSIKNLGSTSITSFNVSYSIDGGSPSANYTVNGINLVTDSTINFTHNIPAPLSIGTHICTVTISNINGGNDEYNTNNSLSKQLCIASQAVAKMPLYEGFSSSTCGPCASFNSSIFNPWVVTNDANINYIKYQVNWPGTGDPYYIAEAGDRVEYYNVIGAPTMIADGLEINGSAMDLDAAKTNANNERSAFLINSTPTYSGKNVYIPISITPYITSSNLTVHAVICEKLTTGNHSSNGETSFHHVMMAMLPSSSGTNVNFTDGTVYTNLLTKSLTLSKVEEMSDLVAIIFIQDNTTKEVLQSKTFDIITTGIDNIAKSNVTLYPNPTTGIVNITNTNNAKINVMNALGQIVITENGTSIDMSNLQNGTYFVQIIENENVTTKKVILNK